jgi:hypothetical protein
MIPQLPPQGEENHANPAPLNNIAPSDRRQRQRPRERATVSGPPSQGAPAAPHSKLFSALKFGKAGFRVLPVWPNTKKGAPDEWQLKATTDRAQIEKWWAEEPDFNIGLLGDGYLVVDIDPARGGLKNWLELTELLEPPPTFTTKTPSGGYHLRYSLPEGTQVGNSNDRLAQGIDIKGQGGQTLAPGSDINGKPYRFLTEPENGIVPLLPRKKGELPLSETAKSPQASWRLASGTISAPMRRIFPRGFGSSRGSWLEARLAYLPGPAVPGRALSEISSR